MEIRTSRLVLREFEESDAPSANTYESDAEVVRYQTHGPRSLDESLAYIQQVRTTTAAQTPRRLFDLAITHNDQFVGRVGLNIKDPALGEGELWYILHPAHWGQGLVPEAARAMLELGFGELGLHRIIIDTDPRNHASVRVAQKLGMRQEAHFVENFFAKNEWSDSLIFALLRREWPGVNPAAAATSKVGSDLS